MRCYLNGTGALATWKYFKDLSSSNGKCDVFILNTSEVSDISVQLFETQHAFDGRNSAPRAK